MKKVNVGMIGSGFAANLHLNAYKKVHGVEVNLKAVASTNAMVHEFAKKNGIQDVYKDYREMLKDKEIDVIDIVTPVFLHQTMVEEAMLAGKHIICEKPLTGYTGLDGDKAPIGLNVSKAKMYEKVMESIDRVKDVVEKSGKLFMYAENWVYAPTVLKSAELLKATKSKILFLKGEEWHSGSHAYHAANWDKTGGGAIIRQGCHPISAVLYLKQVEAIARGENIAIESIIADVGVASKVLTEEERKYIAANPVDVEDWGQLNITFTDGTKASVTAGDINVGGVKNNLEVYCNDSVYICNMAPNNNMMSYVIDESTIKDIYITEKIETKAGWQYVATSEELVRGYVGEIQDFMECVAYGRNPLSGFNLAYDTAKVIYAAYLSAEEGRRVAF